MMYPLIVSAMSMVTVLILAIYVLPKFEDFFATSTPSFRCRPAS